MPLLLTSLVAATATTKSKSSSASSLYLIVVVLLVGVYFLVLRPRQQRAKAQRTNAGKTMSVGDEVVTIGGILGIVSFVDGDSITVEVAPGTHLSFLRRAVNLRTAIAGAPRGTPVTGPVDHEAGVDDEDDATYDDEGWDDQEVAGEEAEDGHPSGSADGEDDDPGGTAGETGKGHGDDPGGKGEGR